MAKIGPAAGMTLAYIESTFSEYGHDANQIKGDEECNNMLANILPLQTPLRGQKINFLFFSESSHSAY